MSIDATQDPVAADPTAKRRRRLRWTAGVLVTASILIGTLGNEVRVQDWDPQYTRVLVERTQAYGGTYYENGIHNKGPLEPALHSLGSAVTSSDGYWYAIAALATLLALFLAYVATRTTTVAGIGGSIAMAVGAATFVHFAFSSAAYAGVMYVRNITIALLAAIWVVAITESAWSTPRRRLLSTVGVAVLAGSTAQSLLTSVPTIAVILVATYLLLRDRAPDWERVRLAGVSFIAFDIAFLSAPIWYWLRGAFAEFWAGWWVYSQYTSAGTRRSLVAQLTHGWQSFFEYHQTRPLVVLVVLAFVVLLWASWRTWDRNKRIMHTAVLAWWVAAWVELALSQRFSTHYFAISALPIALMVALLVAGLVTRLVSEKRHLQYSATVLLGVSLLATYMSGPSHLTDAVRRTVGFRGPGVEAAQEEAQFDGNTRTARAVLDLVSDKGDPLLVWTNAPWPYLIFERVSATRFIWKSFVLGEIYLGARSPEYVLPQTWDWFFEDLAESQPVAAAEVDATLEPGSPFADYVQSRFTKVYSGTLTTVYLRKDILSSVLAPAGIEPWTAPSDPSSPTGWEHSASEAHYSTGATDRVVDLLPLGTSCMSLTGDLSWSPGEETGAAFIFDDTTGANERLHMGIERQRAFSASDFVVYEEKPILGDDRVGFTLVIGERSAVLVIGGEVVTALRLPPSVTVSAQARATDVTLTDLTVGAPPSGSGCS